MGYKFGLRPSKIVFAIYLITPMVYLKISGIYSLKPKKTVGVWAAGVYCNLLVSAIFICQICFANLLRSVV